MVVMIFV
jgi:hypothetical protein